MSYEHVSDIKRVVERVVERLLTCRSMVEMRESGCVTTWTASVVSAWSGARRFGRIAFDLESTASTTILSTFRAALAARPCPFRMM